jgi:hypothetical protein
MLFKILFIYISLLIYQIFFFITIFYFIFFLKYINFSENTIGENGATSVSEFISELSECPLTSFSIDLSYLIKIYKKKKYIININLLSFKIIFIFF